MVTQVLTVSVGTGISFASRAGTSAGLDENWPSLVELVSLAAIAFVAKPAIKVKRNPQATVIIHCTFFEVLNNRVRINTPGRAKE
jgi:hypothetical protein